MADTLKAYTSGAARVYHVEDSMGTLEPGKMADIIVLSGDLLKWIRKRSGDEGGSKLF